MASQPDVDDDDFELPEAEEEQLPAGEGGDDDGEEVVTFEGEAAPEPESQTMRDMRLRLKEANRLLAESRRTAPQVQQPKIVVGERPTIDEFEYDTDKFNAAHDAWLTRRDAAAEQEREATAAEQSRTADLDKVRTSYFAAKAALPYADVQDAEDTAFGELDGVQQMVIAKYAAKPALLIYALGKNPTKLAQISAESDPIKLGQIISKMEATLTTTRRRAPDPEEIPAGRSVSHSSTDAHLEKLEKAAERSGDRTALIAYKRSKKTA